MEKFAKWPIVIFVAIALLSVYLFGFTNGRSSAPGAEDRITLAAARAAYQKYMKDPLNLSGPIRGIVIDKDQYETMGEVLKVHPDAIGFRMYYGIDSTDSHMAIVVGINPSYKDNTDYIYSSKFLGTGLCPVICDEASEITKR